MCPVLANGFLRINSSFFSGLSCKISKRVEKSTLNFLTEGIKHENPPEKENEQDCKDEDHLKEEAQVKVSRVV